jgi:alpha-ketoglutarate-dependent taurine dioxygenase
MVDDQETWLMPDFGYWSWPLELVGGYEQIRMQIEENEPQWSNKIPKLFWRGAEKQNEVRTYLKKETRGKKWADVKEVGWKNRTDVSASSAGTATSIVDHCDYQFLAHTEGGSSLHLGRA